ncbi:hypothetical protein AN958_03489 [Leucoagaricus sp. SymC.cos]|nr:hypothetical protein AN958_03489 [Leucoagaricus sp. SymC.cos]
MNVPISTPIFALLCASVLSSIFVVSITAFTLTVSNLLWIVPPAFILTFVIHVVFFLLANSEDNSNPSGSLRVYSAPLISSLFFTSVVWASVTAVLVFCTVQLLTGRLPSAPRSREWAIITASAVSLVECILLAAVAVQAYKVRQHLRYREKWRWRPGATSSQWR